MSEDCECPLCNKVISQTSYDTNNVEHGMYFGAPASFHSVCMRRQRKGIVIEGNISDYPTVIMKIKGLYEANCGICDKLFYPKDISIKFHECANCECKTKVVVMK